MLLLEHTRRCVFAKLTREALGQSGSHRHSLTNGLPEHGRERSSPIERLTAAFAWLALLDKDHAVNAPVDARKQGGDQIVGSLIAVEPIREAAASAATQFASSAATVLLLALACFGELIERRVLPGESSRI